MNGIGNQENSDSSFYCSLSTNLQVDTLFGLDSGISSDLLFGDTPMPSLSPDMQRVSPPPNRTSLDDGLRTPELPTFPSDDYSNNCEILNHQLVSDINPSLQMTTNNVVDSPSIDSVLIDNHCNGTEVGKNDAFQQKELDISFYSNLDSIPEIPGISPLKGIECSVDNSQNLFEVDKDLRNTTNTNDLKKYMPNSEVSVSAIYHNKIVMNDIPKTIDSKSKQENACVYTNKENESVTDSQKYGCTNSGVELISTTDISSNNYDLKLQSKSKMGDITVSNKEITELKNTFNNSYVTETGVPDNCEEFENDQDLDSKPMSENSAESIDAITAAELAICQMLEAISDTPVRNETTVNHNGTQSELPVVNSCHEVTSLGYETEPISPAELSLQDSESENTKIYVSDMSNQLLNDTINPEFSTENMEIEFVANTSNEEREDVSNDETFSSLYLNNMTQAEFLRKNSLDCVVCLERMDESYVRYLLSCSDIPLYSRNKKSKLEGNTKYTERTYSPAESSSHQKYKCDVCKRHYASASSLEKHKCKSKRSKINNPILEQTHTNKIMSSITCDVCSMTFTDIDVLHDHMEAEHKLVHTSVNMVEPFVYHRKLQVEGSPIISHNLSEIGDEFQHADKIDKNHILFCCQKCSQVFQDQTILVQHLCQMHSNHFMKCDFCKCKFNSESNISSHMLSHANHKAYCCHLCTFASSFQAGLDRHIWAHHTSPPRYDLDDENCIEMKPCSVRLEVLDLKLL